MACLSQEQLAQLAIGITEEPEWTAHLRDCPRCREKLAQLQTVTAQLAAAHNALRRGHAESRRQLLEKLPVGEHPPQPVRTRRQPLSWFKGLNMKQRILLSGVSATAIVALFVTWIALTAKPLFAMELMKESLSKAKSCKTTSVMEFDDPVRPGIDEGPDRISSVIYELAVGDGRFDAGDKYIEIKGKGALSYLNTIYILPAGRPGLEINHFTKTFRRDPVKLGVLSLNPRNHTMRICEELGRHPEKANRSLGTKIIDAKKAHGFAIDGEEVFGDEHEDGRPDLDGPIEVWLDAATHLPIKIHMKSKPGNNQQTPSSTTTTYFQWNIKTDPKLFIATPPQGYVDETPPN